jgi:hypothetical protein
MTQQAQRTISQRLSILILSAAAGVFFSLCILPTPADTLGQEQKDASVKSEKRFVVVNNKEFIVMIDTREDRSWVLGKSETGKPAWLPLAKIENVEQAKSWLAKNVKQKSNPKSSPAPDRKSNENSESKLSADKKFEEWALDVILGQEFGKSEFVVHRWKTAPTVSVFGADERQKKTVQESVAHLNQVLSKTRFGRIEFTDDEDDNADLLIYFAPIRSFAEIAKKHDFKLMVNNEGCFSLKWNAQKEITNGYVLLASDRLRRQSDLRHIVLEEITQSMGLMNDSSTFRNSIFYAGKGGPEKLTQQDQLLLRILYSNLKPGAKRPTVLAAIRRARRQNGK